MLKNKDTHLQVWKLFEQLGNTSTHQAVALRCLFEFVIPKLTEVIDFDNLSHKQNTFLEEFCIKNKISANIHNLEGLNKKLNNLYKENDEIRVKIKSYNKRLQNILVEDSNNTLSLLNECIEFADKCSSFQQLLADEIDQLSKIMGIRSLT